MGARVGGKWWRSTIPPSRHKPGSFFMLASSSLFHFISPKEVKLKGWKLSGCFLFCRDYMEMPWHLWSFLVPQEYSKELQQGVTWHHTLMLDSYYFLVLQGTRSPIAWPTHSPPLRGSYNSSFRHVGWYFLDTVLSLQEQLLEATLVI